MNLKVKDTIGKILSNIKSPIKIIWYQWTVSQGFEANTSILRASPDNAISKSSPETGYTFLCWVQFVTAGWVGSIYPSNPVARTTDVWTTAKKYATTGPSVFGIALYIRTPLV